MLPELKKSKKNKPRDPESMECTCVIIPYVPPTDDSYMEIDWPTIKKKFNFDDGYSDETEDEEGGDAGRMAANLQKITITTKKDGKKVELRAKPADFVDLGQGYVQEDNFIDDSEEYDEYVPSFLDTEYGGFYINDKPVEYCEIESVLVNVEDGDNADADGSTSASNSTSRVSSSSDGSATTNSEEAATEEPNVRKRNAKKAEVVTAGETKEDDGESGGSSEKTDDDASDRKEGADALKKNSHREKCSNGVTSSSEESDDVSAATTKPPRLVGKPPLARLAGRPPTARLAGQPPTMKNAKKKPRKSGKKDTQNGKSEADTNSAKQPNEGMQLAAEALTQTVVPPVPFP